VRDEVTVTILQDSHHQPDRRETGLWRCGGDGWLLLTATASVERSRAPLS
jgi:hypothetical protein